MITKASLKRYIYELFPDKYDRKYSIENWLIRYICKYSDDSESFLKELSINGCSSGCINSLIYNQDCLKFYVKYESEIWEKIREYIESVDYKNFGEFVSSFNVYMEDETIFKINLAWFAVEIAAFKILNTYQTRELK